MHYKSTVAALSIAESTMDFKKATTELMTGVGIEAIAKTLGCSAASIRQARLPEGAKARRASPIGWEGPVADLAEREANRLLRLSKSLQRKGSK
jgi:hypothetical protein